MASASRISGSTTEPRILGGTAQQPRCDEHARNVVLPADARLGTGHVARHAGGEEERSICAARPRRPAPGFWLLRSDRSAHWPSEKSASAACVHVIGVVVLTGETRYRGADWRCS